jgi:hypothetical protein
MFQAQSHIRLYFAAAGCWNVNECLLHCGFKRLKQLGGSSVKEFKNGAPPPRQGQQRGF